MNDHIDERWVKAHSRPPSGLVHVVWSLLNPRISVYWLWLIIVFGVIAAVPVHPFLERITRVTQYLPVATAYSRPDLFDYWQVTLILHTLLTLLIAITAAVRHTVFRWECGRAERLEFSLRQLFASTGILAAIFGLLAWLGAPAVVYFTVLLLYFGWPTTLILAGTICRRRASHEGDSTADRPPDATRPLN